MGEKEELKLVETGALCFQCGELADDTLIEVGYKRKCFDCISE